MLYSWSHLTLTPDLHKYYVARTWPHPAPPPVTGDYKLGREITFLCLVRSSPGQVGRCSSDRITTLAVAWR